MHKIKEEFITDKKGKKTAVIIPIKEYEELMEDLHDISIVAERKDEPTISFEEVEKRLKKMGEYRIDFKNPAYHDLKKIDRSMRSKILGEIKGLLHNPFPFDVKKLKGTESIYRIRTGDYRVIYPSTHKILRIYPWLIAFCFDGRRILYDFNLGLQYNRKKHNNYLLYKAQERCIRAF